MSRPGPDTRETFLEGNRFYANNLFVLGTGTINLKKKILFFLSHKMVYSVTGKINTLSFSYLLCPMVGKGRVLVS